MYYLFWGVILLMTLIALVSLFVSFQHRSLPILAKCLIVLMLPILAIGLYFYVGNSQELLRYWHLKREANAVKLALTKIKNPQQVVDQLKTFLQTHPNHPKGWYLLGKLYYGQKDFIHAVLSLKKSAIQSPNNLVYAVAYAEADFFFQHRHLSPSMRKLLRTVLGKDRHNVGALNLLAIDGYLRGQYTVAIHDWEQLLPLFPAGSKDQKFLLSMIAKAQLKRSDANRLK